MSLYEYTTGEKQKSTNVYIVYYKNWLDIWTADTQEFTTKAKAKARQKYIAKNCASNGVTTVNSVPKSKSERAKLACNINKF